MLQQQLEEIRNNNYMLDNKVNIDSLSSNMLEHIGVTDSYLRDKLIYSTFYHLIKKGIPFTHAITETTIRKHQ